MSIDPFLWLPDTVKLGLSDKTKWMGIFFPVLIVLWSCILFSATHSYSLHPVPQLLFLETLLSLVMVGPQTSPCKFGTFLWWSRMLKPELKACQGNCCSWHARGQWEQAWVRNWCIHHCLGPPKMRDRKVLKGESPMSEPEKFSMFNPCAP